MPAEAEHRIHILLVADPAQHLLLVRDVVPHDALAVAEALLPPAREDVACFGVGHGAVAVGLVEGPVARVGVAVGVVHRAVGAGLAAAAIGARVGGAGEGDVGSLAVGAAVGEGDGEVGVGEVGVCEVACVVGGVVVAQEVEGVVDWGDTFPGSFEGLDTSGKGQSRARRRKERMHNKFYIRFCCGTTLSNNQEAVPRVFSIGQVEERGGAFDQML